LEQSSQVFFLSGLVASILKKNVPTFQFFSSYKFPVFLLSNSYIKNIFYKEEEKNIYIYIYIYILLILTKNFSKLIKTEKKLLHACSDLKHVLQILVDQGGVWECGSGKCVKIIFFIF
jgi:hypothetical protein